MVDDNERISAAMLTIERMLKNEYGIKTGDDFTASDGEELAVIYENIKIVQEEFNLSDDELDEIMDRVYPE